MKSVIILAMSFVMISAIQSNTYHPVNTNELMCKNNTVYGSSYCKGFFNGFVEGYEYRCLSCVSPVPPPCPTLKINEENTYQGGYNRGFQMGQARRNKDRN
jgi:hypothetical protein